MTTLFSWGCDTATITNWTFTGGGHSVDSTQGRPGGNGICHKNHATGGSNDNELITYNDKLYQLTYSGVYFIRAWAKVSADWTWSNVQRAKTSRWVGGVEGVGSGLMTFHITPSGIGPSEHSNSGFTSDAGSGSGGDGPDISGFTLNTTWKEVVLKMTMHSSDGATDGRLDLVVNGSIVSSLTGVCWWNTSNPNWSLTGIAANGGNPDIRETWGCQYLSGYWQDADGDYFVDDVSIDTTWNSTTYADPFIGGVAPTRMPLKLSMLGLGAAYTRIFAKNLEDKAVIGRREFFRRAGGLYVPRSNLIVRR